MKLQNSAAVLGCINLHLRCLHVGPLALGAEAPMKQV